MNCTTFLIALLVGLVAFVVGAGLGSEHTVRHIKKYGRSKEVGGTVVGRFEED